MKSRSKVMGTPGSTDLPSAFAAEAVDKLRDTYLPWIERALESLDETTVWARPREGVNSIGNLLLHLNGNVTQWMLHGLGGEEDKRDRDSEFQADGGTSADELFQRLSETVQRACEVIQRPRSEAEWLTPITIQGFSTTALSAVVHVVEHFSYHTGQIVILAKSATGEEFRFYDL